MNTKKNLLGSSLTFALVCLTFTLAWSQAPVTNTYTTSGTYNVPVNITTLTVECWGAGGGGGGATSSGTSNGGGGGGGGGYTKSVISVAPGSSIPFIVGVGGPGGPQSTNGTPGGSTTFSSVTALGGQGGFSAVAGAVGGIGGAGSGTLVFVGGPGGNGFTGTNGYGAGGGGSAGSTSNGFSGSDSNCCGIAAGGPSVFEGGFGGTGGFSGNPGNNGFAPGAGGGGGASGTAPGRTGGSGANGQIRVTYQPPSSLSTVVEDAGFSYPGSIPYQSYLHGGTSLTVGAAPPSDAIAVARFFLVDPADADTYSTILNFISFTVTNPGNLKYLSIQDNSTGLILQSLAAAPSVTFSGLGLTAPDGVPMPFTIYATFNSSVTDNTHFELQVSNVISGTGGSTFQFSDGGTGSGGARSSTIATNNKVIVTANTLKFVQAPSNTLLGVAMSPSPSVEAVDAFGSRDLDFAGVVNLTSSGTLSTAPAASMGVGFGNFSPVTHSVAGTGLTLTTTNGFGFINAVSTTFNVTTSASSDIIANTSFTYPTNIAYANFQESVDITNSGTSVVIAKFDVRDGAGAADSDQAPTILSSISLNLGSNFGLLRRVALYDAAGTSEIGADVNVTSSTVSWSGLALSAADNGTASFTLRASFKSSVTDNLQVSATVSAAGTQANTSSTFATANAGAAATSIAGNNNRIEVTATALAFSQNIVNANILGGVNVNTQQTSPQLVARDPFGNTDLDYATSVSLTPSANVSAPTLTVDNAAPNAGVYTFPASFQFILTGPVTLTAAAAGLTSAISNPATILPGAPNGATGVTDASFTPSWSSWSGTPAATGYLLDVSTASNFSSFVTGYNGLAVGNVSSYNVNTNLTGNTLYYYRIKVVTGSGTSISSPSNSVTTAPAAPSMSAFTGVSDVAFTVNWAASPAATGYFLDISTNPGFSSFLASYNNFSAGNVTSVAVSGLSANTTYYIRVRASNSNGTSGSSNSSILTAPLPPTPSFGAINNTAFSVNWTASPGASNYAIDVSALSNFSVLLSGYNNQATGNVTTYTVNSGLSANTLYYVRLRATNGTSISGNASGSVTTAPSPPVMQAASLINSTDFTANWSASTGATSYALDVSTDNFSTTVAGYSGLSVAGTSKLVTGLQANTTYQYRARAVNGAAISLNPALASTALTIPSAPVTTAATGVTQNAFTINWNSMAGITNFRLDVAAVSDFSTRLTGFDNLAVTGTSKSIGSLTAGTTYYYRLRAVNATNSSANSNLTTVITVPPEPVAIAATSISPTGFVANWNAAQAADSYLLDVSTASDFSALLSGYSGKSVALTNDAIVGLSKGTVYYYRVRAVNASGTSGNSNTISQITIPEVPTLNTVTIKNSNTFIASWVAVAGADSYEIDVSTFASQFGTFVSGFNAASVPASANPESLVTGLAPGTAYSFRVRSVNTGGKSASSVPKSMLTDPGSGQAPTFSVTVTSNNGGLFTSTGTSVQGTVANGVGVVSGTFSYKGITEATATKTKAFTAANNSFIVPIDDTMLDELGVEYVITVKDETDATKSTTADRIYRSFSASSSPVVVNSTFEGSKSSIRIISIPYDLKDNLIESIFSSLGAYDKTTWRLAHFQQAQGNVEFREGINKIERGLGYWFNAKGTVNIRSGDGSVGTYNQAKPFTLNLVTGWNQIGNPFPFAIDWSDVLADNKSVTGVGNLKVYNGSKANYDDGNKMEAFTGGFVHADKDATLLVNVALRNTANGGRVTSANESFDLGSNEWRLPLSVRQNNSIYDLGTVGMNTDANVDKDPYDEVRLPRLDEYLDITFDHPQSKFRYFTRDILPTGEKGTWTFTVGSNAPDANAIIAWDNTRFGHSNAKIWLLDPAAARWIDMTTTSEYTFNNPGEKEFKVYYSKDGAPVFPDLMLAGPVYPNPTIAGASFSLILPERPALHLVDVSVIDITGHPIRTILSGTKPAGVHTIEWDGMGSGGVRPAAGIYLIKAQVNEKFVSIQKLLVK